jgi:hypothetical protein
MSAAARLLWCIYSHVCICTCMYSLSKCLWGYNYWLSGHYPSSSFYLKLYLHLWVKGIEAEARLGHIVLNKNRMMEYVQKVNSCIHVPLSRTSRSCLGGYVTPWAGKLMEENSHVLTKVSSMTFLRIIICGLHNLIPAFMISVTHLCL